MRPSAAGLVRRWELKLLSLVVAFAVWLLVTGRERAEIVLPARIEYQNIASGLMLMGPTPDVVDLQVRGVRSSLARLTPDDLRVPVDLARLGAGEAVVQLVPDKVRAPRDITVVRVNPSRLRVTLEPVVTAEVRIVPRLAGTPEPGYVMGGVSVVPPVAEIRGPRSEVANRPELQTLPIDISGARAPVTRSVELLPPPGATRLSSRQAVDVTVEIRAERALPARGASR